MRFQLILAAVLLLCCTAVSAATIKDIRYNRTGNKVQLVLDLDAPTRFSQFSLASPPRIVLDIPNAKRTGRTGITINQGAVKSLRTNYLNNTTIRAVIDLRMPAKANIYALKPEGGRGNRIVIDVHDASSIPPLSLTSINTKTPNMASVKKASDKNQPKRLPAQKTAPTSKQHRTSPREAVLQNPANRKKTSSKRSIIVCIDPGHGGKDPGAHNPITGAREKDVVLAISKRLRDIINRTPGYRAIMTRDTDIYIPLPNRPKKCRAQKADIFVSIHADSVAKPQPSGSSVYILSTTGASSQLAQYLAANENSVDLKWGASTKRYDTDVQKTLFNMQLEATLASSNTAAKRTIAQLGRIGNVHKRNVEQANFVVLRSPGMPSLLVETGFISNLSEAKLLTTPSYQNKIALGIAAGIKDYFRDHLPQHILLSQ